MAKDRVDGKGSSSAKEREEEKTDVLFALSEQAQVDFEIGEGHVRALVETDLMLPQVDDENLRREVSDELRMTW